MTTPAVPDVLIERAAAEPKPDRLNPQPPFAAPYLNRRGIGPTDPFGIRPEEWRYIIARAPIAALCIRTLILQITALDWKVSCDDKGKITHFTEVIDNANGESFDAYCERVVYDMLTVPFGGATEVVKGKKGETALFYHVDGGTMFPTYDPDEPYVQIDPYQPMRRVWFTREQIKRLTWAPMTDMANYGWSRPPVMEIFFAVEQLMRSDVFYGQFLSNTPEAGILDLMDMDAKSAREWVKSWQELMIGIDPLKVPVLYDHEQPAKWIPFSRPPGELALPDLTKRYAEVVVGAFGMNIGDIGLFEHQNTLAGSSRMQANSKRQGLGSILRKIKNLINSMLPPDVIFTWEAVDEEDRLRRANAMKIRADTLKILATADPTTQQAIMPLKIIRQQAILDGLINVLDINDVDLTEIEQAAKADVAAAQPPPGAETAPGEQTAPGGAPAEPALAPAPAPGQTGADLLRRHAIRSNNKEEEGWNVAIEDDNEIRLVVTLEDFLVFLESAEISLSEFMTYDVAKFMPDDLRKAIEAELGGTLPSPQAQDDDSNTSEEVRQSPASDDIPLGPKERAWFETLSHDEQVEWLEHRNTLMERTVE